MVVLDILKEIINVKKENVLIVAPLHSYYYKVSTKEWDQMSCKGE